MTCNNSAITNAAARATTEGVRRSIRARYNVASSRVVRETLKNLWEEIRRCNDFMGDFPELTDSDEEANKLHLIYVDRDAVADVLGKK